MERWDIYDKNKVRTGEEPWSGIISIWQMMSII